MKGVKRVFQGGKRKNAKEQEQELMARQEELERLSQAMERIKEAGSMSSEIFTTLEKERGNFDESLNQVVDNMKQIHAGEQERFEEESRLRRGMRERLKEQGRMADQYGQALEAVGNGEKQLLSIVEQNKYFTDPTKALNQFTKEMVLEASQLVADIAGMKEMGRQMGVLALNAAIEAGRMGESGRRFVAAAEEVRVTAENYQGAAEGLLTRVMAISKQIEAAQEEVSNLTGLLRENNIHIAKTAQTVTASVKELEQADISKGTQELSKVLDDWEAAAKKTALHEDYFQRSLDSMEQAGETFMREQQAMEQLKEQWMRIQLEAENV